eukprot:UN26069
MSKTMINKINEMIKTLDSGQNDKQPFSGLIKMKQKHRNIIAFICYLYRDSIHLLKKSFIHSLLINFLSPPMNESKLELACIILKLIGKQLKLNGHNMDSYYHLIETYNKNTTPKANVFKTYVGRDHKIKKE